MWWPALPIMVLPQVSDLPTGSSPLPVVLPHFPDRLHAFVWRNWQLVPAERMAAVVGASRADIVRIGRSMGLSGPPRISPDQLRRSYVSIIRRNWHLLPYDQLLALLGWSAERMAFTLREDDFLFVKLGNLKPRCDPLRYTAPDERTRAAARSIAQAMHAHFPEGIGQLPNPLFRFVRDLRRPLRAAPLQIAHEVSPRFSYSYFGLYGDPLSEPDLDPYPDGYLTRLAEVGVDGVWLQSVLYKLCPFPWEPSLSAGYEERLARLRELVARAKRRGIRVFLYLNEPRAMRMSFFQRHPELKGVEEAGYGTLCTSLPEVQRYLRDSVASICRAVPDLGGFFTITMSENLTNCYSHGQAQQCPRCSKRSGAEVIAEVNRALHAGVLDAQGRQEFIVWDWGWPDEWAEAAIRALPDGVCFMSVSEWSLPIERGGVASAVGEYSISAVGPGPRAQRHWAIARERGLRVLSKVQAAATWELSATPYVPAMQLVAQHAANLRQAGVTGVMLSWTVGGYPSPNLEVFVRTLAGMEPDASIIEVARRRYGTELAPDVVQAWADASRSFQEFPFHIATVYTGPHHAGPSNLLWLQPTGYRATMVGIPYDDLESWRSIYPPEVFVEQMRKASVGFQTGAERLRARLAAANGFRQALELEAGILEACALHLASSADQAAFILLRGQYEKADRSEKGRIAAQMKHILRAEIERAKRLYALQTKDPRIGFEATAHYYYVPVDLGEKVLNCLDLLRTLETP